MTVVKRSAIVAYSAGEMYDLVADIPKYPEFLPWCDNARIDTAVGDVVTATVGINFKGIRKSFTTRNQQQPSESITLSLVDGPFSRLDGEWRFKALKQSADDPPGSEIALSLEFDFSSRLLAGLVGPVFGHIANTMVDAFHERAVAVYGKR